MFVVIASHSIVFPHEEQYFFIENYATILVNLV